MRAAGIFCRLLMEGGGCFPGIVMENVFRAADCDGKQGKSAPRRQDIHVASHFNKTLSLKKNCCNHCERNTGFTGQYSKF